MYSSTTRCQSPAWAMRIVKWLAQNLILVLASAASPDSFAGLGSPSPAACSMGETFAPQVAEIHSICAQINI